MQDLLDLLAFECHCDYLSDLPIVFRERLSPDFLRDIAQDAYPLSDWLEAIRYLTAENLECTSVDAARQFLLEKMDRA